MTFAKDDRAVLAGRFPPATCPLFEPHLSGSAGTSSRLRKRIGPTEYHAQSLVWQSKHAVIDDRR